MKKQTHLAGLCGLAMLCGHAAQAQDAGFTWEAEIEIGVDSTVSSDDPTAEFSDLYLSIEAAFEAAITDRITAFGGLTLESVTDPTDDRSFDDLGLYVNELGLRFGFGETLVSVGKLSPVFGMAWDDAPGYYGTSLSGDYELAEMIGLTVDTPLGADGTLSLAVFYADNSVLSDSIGNRRGRNSVAAGGVGNTGKLNNIALQFSREFGATTAWVGARHLAAGTGDVSDENGVVAGLAHDFGNGWDMIGEMAHFSGAGGTTADATYSTLGATYVLDQWSFSGTGTVVNTSGAGRDKMLALGIDRQITDNSEINFGLARFDVGGVKSTAVGLAAVVSF